MKNHPRTIALVFMERDTIKRTAHVLIVVAVALMIIYTAFLSRTIFAVVSRRTTESETKMLSAHIAELEVSYLKKTSEIDLSMARALGFQDTGVVTFATRTKTALR